MKMYQLVITAFAWTWSLNAQAQWQWLDKEGRKVFSDLAPPPDISQDKILKQPGGQRVPAPIAPLLSPATAAEPAALPYSAPKPAVAVGADKELQQRKAQVEAEEAGRKKIEAAKNATLRADNCGRAQRAKTEFESGRPIRQTNGQGELVWLDETGRAAEVHRLQSIIASDCGPRPW